MPDPKTQSAPDTKQEFKKSTTRDYYETLLVTMVLLNFARIFVFQTFKIPTGSMEDNLKIGDHIVVNKFVYGNEGPEWFAKMFPFREIQRGDIIVFRYPKDPDVDYVKRVIGLPGETISITDKKVLINGKELKEPYTLFADPMVYPDDYDTPGRIRDQMSSVTVPDGYYFAMGDNRDLSADSRYWGYVPRAYIKGRPFIVYWSFRSPSANAEVPQSRLRELLNVVIRFFPDTRWGRTGYIVDSSYHRDRD